MLELAVCFSMAFKITSSVAVGHPWTVGGKAVIAFPAFVTMARLFQNTAVTMTRTIYADARTPAGFALISCKSWGDAINHPSFFYENIFIILEYHALQV